MTILLSKEQEALLERVMASGLFDSLEDFIDQSLTVALTEHEAFNRHLRTLLDESREDIEHGRLVEVPRGQLLQVIRERRRERPETKER